MLGQAVGVNAERPLRQPSAAGKYRINAQRGKQRNKKTQRRTALAAVYRRRFR